ncbi:hypothetical protein RRG08_001705 [Elysia crispata]|uniref:Uncharacterized protein n=1 Tax=Elysia crispata TaxID=231223 RepID=A0AAE1E0Q9_9GAST|nr:hypothetical protein RRG08_001705 [Elysia crispata]
MFGRKFCVRLLNCVATAHSPESATSSENITDSGKNKTPIHCLDVVTLRPSKVYCITRSLAEVNNKGVLTLFLFDYACRSGAALRAFLQRFSPSSDGIDDSMNLWGDILKNELMCGDGWRQMVYDVDLHPDHRNSFHKADLLQEQSWWMQHRCQILLAFQ